MKQPRPAALEGGDPDPEDDDILSASGPVEVSREAAMAAVANVIGSGAAGRVRAKRILDRLAAEGWRIIADR